MKLTMKEVQCLESEMLKAVDEICQKHHIHYQVMFGTLLGTVRHHGPIPWDSDVDIVVPEEENVRLIELLKQELPDKFRVSYRENPKHLLLIARVGLKEYSTRNVHVDIFRAFGLPERKWKQIVLCLTFELLLKLRIAKVYNYTGKKRILSIIVRVLFCWLPLSVIISLYDGLYKKHPTKNASKVVFEARRFSYREPYDPSVLTDVVRLPYDSFDVNASAMYDHILTRHYNNYMEFPPEKVRQAGCSAMIELKVEDEE